MKSTVRFICAVVCFLSANLFAQGPTAPAAPPGPTMKTLNEVQPGTPISSIPITITSPGYYYFTTNLYHSSTGSAVVINSDHVTVDLNGFTLSGTTSGLSGIDGQYNRYLTIRNGGVTTFSEYGVVVGAQSLVEDMALTGCFAGLYGSGKANIAQRIFATSNITYGAAFGGSALIQDSRFERNLVGAAIHDNTRVLNSVFNENVYCGLGPIAFSASFGVIDGCIASFNDGTGFLLDHHNVIRGCQAAYNGTNGFVVGNHNVLEACSASQNEGTAGFVLSNHNTIRGSSSSDNQAAGTVAGNQLAVHESTFTRNAGHGLSAGNDLLASAVNASSNTGRGITGSRNVAVAGSVANRNGSYGIELSGPGGRVSDSSANQNAYGIFALQGAVIENCSTYGNANDGISVFSGCNVRGCTSAENTDNGFVLDSDNTAVGNSASYNGLAGFDVNSTGNDLRENQSMRNNIGFEIGASRNFVVKNSAGYNTTTNYLINAGNRDAVNVYPASGHTGVDPWANLNL